jgi:hypothetical protein
MALALEIESVRGGDDCVNRTDDSQGASPITAGMERRSSGVLSRPAWLTWFALVGRRRMVANDRVRAIAVIAPWVSEQLDRYELPGLQVHISPAHGSS